MMPSLCILLALLAGAHAQTAVAPGAPQPKAQGAATPASTYSVVIDAGTTGSRVHVFKYEGAGKGLKLVSDVFQAIRPSMAAYPTPQAAAASLKPLIDVALASVPKAQQASTQIQLLAAEGLQLVLPSAQAADATLAATRAYLKTLPFSLCADCVRYLSGEQRAAYDWLTLNYLSGKLGAAPANTLTAVDLGGTAVQEAFALTPAEARAAPASYVMSVAAAGSKYSLYVNSYLGYGQMPARARVIAAGKDAPQGNPCFAKGTELTFELAGFNFSVPETKGPGSFPGCSQIAVKALNLQKPCGKPQATCSFDGVWRPRDRNTGMPYVIVSNGTWDEASEVGIVAGNEATTLAKTTPRSYARAATSVCGKQTAELAKQYPSVRAAGSDADYLCMDLTFDHALLTKGFDLTDNSPITLVKQVNYNGKPTWVTWPLGASLDSLDNN